MADRNEYMREYMREYRAAKKAARLVETGGASGPTLAIVKSGGAPGDTIPAASSTSSIVTEPGQEITELGIYARYKWAWWLLAGIVAGACLYAVIHVPGAPPEERAGYLIPLESETTEPVNTEGQDLHQGDSTEETEGQAADDSTEPGQE